MANTHSDFYIAIETVFKSWTALQLAVAHSFGGAQSRVKEEWFVGATEQWFNENSGIDPYELEDFLGEIMSTEFNSFIEDNSSAEVATEICRFYNMIRQGKKDELNTILGSLRTNTSAVSSSQRCPASDDDDNDDDDMDVDNHNMMSHMNALELSSASQPSPGQAKPTNPSGSSATAGSSDNGDLSVENQAEEDNGWTTVSKGGRRKKGK